MLYSHNHNDINPTVHIHTQIQTQADSVVQLRLFINFLTSVLRQEVKSFPQSYYVNPTLNIRHILWCLRSQFISASRDLKKTQLFDSMAESPTLATMAENSILCLQLTLNPQLTLFQNPHILWIISNGHDVIHTPAPFPVCGLL